MPDLVIYGIGPFARLMQYYFEHDSNYRVVAFTADPEFIKEESFCGAPVLPLGEVAARYPPGEVDMFVAIGYRRMRNRKLLFNRAKTWNYTLANYVSSRCICPPGLQIGENNVAFGNVQFEPFVRIGNNNCFWSNTLICHEASIGNNNHFSAKCVIGGYSVVEDECFLGIGALIIDSLTIKRESHILPGAVVLQTTEPFHKYMGNPARSVGSHENDGIVIERG